MDFDKTRHADRYGSLLSVTNSLVSTFTWKWLVPHPVKIFHKKFDPGYLTEERPHCHHGGATLCIKAEWFVLVVAEGEAWQLQI